MSSNILFRNLFSEFDTNTGLPTDASGVDVRARRRSKYYFRRRKWMFYNNLSPLSSVFLMLGLTFCKIISKTLCEYREQFLFIKKRLISRRNLHISHFSITFFKRVIRRHLETRSNFNNKL